MKWYILIGMGAFVGAAVLLGIMGIQEQQRMQDFTRSYDARRIEEGAAVFETNCIRCHGPQGDGVPGLAPALNTTSMFDGTRLKELGFAGALQDFLTATISSGRPVPSEGTNYPERMPTWSEEYGGPLRVDQIENVVAFIMNWGPRALAAGQPTEVSGPMMGHDFSVTLPAGDADRGKALTEAGLGCAACHVVAKVGPPWAGNESMAPLAVRAAERFQQSDYTGNATTEEQYLVESVLLPQAYIVPGYEDVQMPTNFGDRVTVQDMADLLAYMLTFK